MKKWRFALIALVITIMAAAILLLAVRGIGICILKKVPEGGINEAHYVEINGSRQWISIYGQDLSNPVLLYLHGGPGDATSAFDYAFTRKWSDVYTVVTWDQRNCGKSYDENLTDVTLTYELLMQDGLEMTQYILNYLDQEKLTLLGHSWGSYFGANLALSYPSLYDAFIGTGQLVDARENEIAFQEVSSHWIGDDEEGKTLWNSLTPDAMTAEHYRAKNKLLEKYQYHMFCDGRDYSVFLAAYFNPYYSIGDWIRLEKSDSMQDYMRFLLSDEFSYFSLRDDYVYEIPYYNINGDRDYQTNYLIAEAYFDSIEAPRKALYMMENTTHGLLEARSERFSDLLHEIAEKERKASES